MNGIVNRFWDTAPEEGQAPLPSPMQQPTLSLGDADPFSGIFDDEEEDTWQEEVNDTELAQEIEKLNALVETPPTTLLAPMAPEPNIPTESAVDPFDDRDKIRDPAPSLFDCLARRPLRAGIVTKPIDNYARDLRYNLETICTGRRREATELVKETEALYNIDEDEEEGTTPMVTSESELLLEVPAVPENEITQIKGRKRPRPAENSTAEMPRTKRVKREKIQKTPPWEIPGFFEPEYVAIIQRMFNKVAPKSHEITVFQVTNDPAKSGQAYEGYKTFKTAMEKNRDRICTKTVTLWEDVEEPKRAPSKMTLVFFKMTPDTILSNDVITEMKRVLKKLKGISGVVAYQRKVVDVGVQDECPVYVEEIGGPWVVNNMVEMVDMSTQTDSSSEEGESVSEEDVEAIERKEMEDAGFVDESPCSSNGDEAMGDECTAPSITVSELTQEELERELMEAVEELDSEDDYVDSGSDCETIPDQDPPEEFTEQEVAEAYGFDLVSAQEPETAPEWEGERLSDSDASDDEEAGAQPEKEQPPQEGIQAETPDEMLAAFEAATENQDPEPQIEQDESWKEPIEEIIDSLSELAVPEESDRSLAGEEEAEDIPVVLDE